MSHFETKNPKGVHTKTCTAGRKALSSAPNLKIKTATLEPPFGMDSSRQQREENIMNNLHGNYRTEREDLEHLCKMILLIVQIFYYLILIYSNLG